MSKDGIINRNVINWFPGHMAKARRELEAKLKLVDLIIELRDSRVPLSSANPLFSSLIKNKARLIILVKSLMADPKITKEFIEHFNAEGLLALDCDMINSKNISLIKNYIAKASKSILDKREKQGIINKEIKICVIGVPNVGKSTFINRLAGKSSLNVGNKPGITKNTNTWLRIDKNYIILDTPGILYPKLKDEKTGYNLAICGMIKDEILPHEELCYYAIDYIKANYPDLLKKRYLLNELNDTKDIIEEIGQKRGCLKSLGEIDLNKTYRLILQDVKNARLGAISYERPED